MREEMEEVLKEMRDLEVALLTKTDALKLAETRLENRLYRAGVELCCDEPEKGLKEEVLQLRQTRKDLQDKIDCATATYNALEEQKVRIDKNLDDKCKGLMTDIRSLGMRIRLRTGEFGGSATSNDRYIQLTRMEEIPPS
ncbi:unnamed protein product [Diabrotica balteata]|uniref:Tektin n=1 Tax=Diabrotica balteata TaxID=107213 RepID=A0A9N9SXB3_DIABA|nr:unnamed protein product [Diabrotica balteata]